MTAVVEQDQRIQLLAKASRRSALVSLGGFLLVMAALVYAAFQLTALERARNAAQAELDELHKQVGLYQTQVAQLQDSVAKVTSDLARSRASLSSARAAITAFHQGRLDEAVALYDEALNSDPDNAYLLNLRAYALFHLGRLDEAIEGQRRSVAVDPGYAWGYFDLARFLCASSPEHLEEARQAAQRAVALRPDMLTIMQSDGEFQRVCKSQVPSKRDR